MLRRAGHDCVTAPSAGLATASDDTLAVFADNHRAVLLTHDSESTQRRKKNTFGRHVQLDCQQWEAEHVLEQHIEEVLVLVKSRADIVIRVSRTAVVAFPTVWE